MSSAIAFLLLAPVAQLFNPPKVDPMTFASRSGELTLDVDPGDRSGKGAAHYVMRRGAEIAWEKELPFTLVNLVISEDGRVAGFARDRSALRTFVLGAAGEVLGSDSRKKTYTRGPDWECTQHARATLLDEERDQFTVVVVDQIPRPQTELRRVFDLRDCSLIREFRPEKKLAEGDRHGQSVEQDPATRSITPAASSDCPVVHLDERSPVELQFVPLRPGSSRESSDADSRSTGERTRSTGELAEDELSFYAAGVGVGPSGRVYIQEARTGSVHVFTRDGSHWRTARANGEDSNHVNPIATLAIGSAGDIYVERQRHAYRLDCLHFDPNGTRVGVVDPGAFPLAFVPGKDRFWGWDDHDLVLMTTAGEELRRIERRPGDRNWLVRSEEPAVASDGRFVVVTGGLACFGPGGEPLATIALPADAGSRVAFSGRWAVVFEHGPRALLVDVQDASIFRFEPPDVPDGTAWFWAVSPEGDEVWMINRYGTTWRRFRLPD